MKFMHNHTHYDRNIWKPKKENLDTSSHHIQRITVRMTAGVCSGNSEGQRQCIDIKSTERRISTTKDFIFKTKSVFQESESEIKMYPGKQAELHC